MNNRRNILTYIFWATLFLFLTISAPVLSAQTDPEETAVPYPITTPLSEEREAYPANVQPPTITPANPTPYPIFTATPVSTVTTLPVVGDNGNSFPSTPVETAPSATTSEIIQSSLVLWVGFIIGLLMVGMGIYGAIILYQRK